MQREFSPMNAAEIMDKVVDVYKKSFWRQMAWAAIFYVAAFFGTMIFAFITVFLLSFVTIFLVTAGMDDANVFGVFGLAVVALLLPLFLLWQATTSTGHILLAKPEFYGYRKKIFEAGLLKVILRVLTALLAQILFAVPFFIVAAAALIVFLTSVENFFIMESPVAFFSFLALIAAIGLGYLAYSHVFSLSVAVAIFEDCYFFGTIKRSWELVKTDFFRTLGIRTIWFIVVMVVSSTIQGAFQLLTQLSVLIAGAVPWFVIITFFVALFAVFIGPAVAGLLTAPLDGIMQVSIYFNQRIKNEGFGVELRLEKLLHERPGQ
ncbi:MAG: hypothetical protein FWF77_02700 [Defluviitaleaceae bacterium]|nr:hypothetical protein [Defluviitaleaceae bacterium]